MQQRAFSLHTPQAAVAHPRPKQHAPSRQGIHLLEAATVHRLVACLASKATRKAAGCRRRAARTATGKCSGAALLQEEAAAPSAADAAAGASCTSIPSPHPTPPACPHFAATLTARSMRYGASRPRQMAAEELRSSHLPTVPAGAAPPANFRRVACQLTAHLASPHPVAAAHWRAVGGRQGWQDVPQPGSPHRWACLAAGDG